MQRLCLTRLSALTVLLLFVAVGAPAAAVGVADPGFSYVDVNNDGLYDPTVDIGLLSTPSVDIDALIISDGQFDTQQDKGPYHAPCYPVTLVIPASRSFALTVPLKLHAGYNMLIYGRLIAPSICLSACRNIDLSNSASVFRTQMNVSAGRDVILDGAAINGTDPSSQLYVSACRDISVRKFADNPTQITTGSLVSLCAGGCMYLDGAHITTLQTGSSITLDASGALEGVDQTLIATQNAGDVVARSRCSLVRLENDIIDGKTLLVDANCSASVNSSFINTTGATTIQANGPVDGNLASPQSLPTNISCSCLTVYSCDCVDLDSSIIKANPGGIQVTGRGDVTANSVDWTAGTRIDVKSTCGNIIARMARMEVKAPLGPITFYAGGGLIIVTGSVFVGTVTYGPSGVTVIGPAV